MLHLFGKRLKDVVGKTGMFGKYTCGEIAKGKALKRRGRQDRRPEK